MLRQHRCLRAAVTPLPPGDLAGTLVLNPYKAPAASTEEADDRPSLLTRARPEVAAALWFVGVSVVHFGIVLILSTPPLGDLSINYSPLLWLVFSIGLYFRLGPVRRFILLIGAILMVSTVLFAVASLLDLPGDTSIQFGSDTIDNPPLWAELLFCFAYFAAFAYPVVVLWPRHVRARFRDRIPVNRPGSSR